MRMVQLAKNCVPLGVVRKVCLGLHGIKKSVWAFMDPETAYDWVEREAL